MIRSLVRPLGAFVASVLVAVAPFLANTPPVAAAPTLTPWAVLLCKYGDHGEEPMPVDYFRRLFSESGAGTGGLYDYWRDVTYGQIDLTGSKVFGWYSLPTAATMTEELKKSRAQRIDDCIQAARTAGYTIPSGYHIVVSMNAWTDGGADGIYGRVLTNPDGWGITLLAHEMGHAYGLDHSWDNRNNCEYCDPFDIMSAMSTFSYTGTYGYAPSTWPPAMWAGPGLVAPDLFKLGTLSPTHPRVWDDRLSDPNPQGSDSTTITLAALNDRNLPVLVNNTPGIYLAARIPTAGTDGLEHVYTVEFRRQARWDRGLAVDAVLVHEIRPDGRVVLIDDPTAQWRPGQTFDIPASNIRVSVRSFDTAASTARVNIRHVTPRIIASVSGGALRVWGTEFTPGGSVHIYAWDRTAMTWVVLSPATTIGSTPTCVAGAACDLDGLLTYSSALPASSCGHAFGVFAIEDTGGLSASTDTYGAC